jgi:serine protease Do
MKKAVFILIMLGFFVSASFAGGFPAVEVYEKASKAVVLVLASHEGGGSGMIGTGSIIKPDMVITNAHVIYDKSTSSTWKNIRVYLKPKKVTGSFKNDLVHRYVAHVLAYDVDLDLAILKVDNLPSERGVIELANADEIKIGEEVVAIGHPEQGGLWTLTYGRISGEIDNFNAQGRSVYQTDTNLNRGNSGGPLLDRRGYLVGVNAAAARLGDDNMPITGINFSIKSSVAKRWLEKQQVRIAYGKKSLNEETQVVSTQNVESTPKTDENNPAEKQETTAAPAEQKVAEIKPQTTETKPKIAEVIPPVTETKPPVPEIKPSEKQKDITEGKKPVKVEEQPKSVDTKPEEKQIQKPKEGAKAVQKDTQKQNVEKKQAKADIQEKVPSGTMYPDKKPYKIEDLMDYWKQVEKEMEGQIDDSRKRIEEMRKRQ